MTPLPQLVDCKGLQNELRVKRATAEAIMRALEDRQVKVGRRVFVRREDVQRVLDTGNVAA